VEKRGALASLVAPIQFRLSESVDFYRIASQCLGSLNASSTALENITLQLEVSPEEAENLIIQTADLEKWTLAKMTERDSLEPSKDPVVTSDEVKGRCEALFREAMKLLRRPKRKPPSPPPPPPTPPPSSPSPSPPAGEGQGTNGEKPPKTDTNGDKQEL